MNLPFIRFFKKDKAGEGSVAVVAPVTPMEKPASARFGKTVMPNSSRIVGLEPVKNFPTAPPASAPAPSRKISLGGSGSVAVGSKVTPSGPAAERTIALPLADLVPNIPTELLKPTPVDPERRVTLKASEVERGMATGRPTALLRAIYKQAPEFFTSEVPAADLREVALPFKKVVEQFASFQVREDQIVDQECPQLETPFLQVTLEDNERFGKAETTPPARGNPVVQPPAVAESKPAVGAEKAKIKMVVEAKPEAVTEAKPEAATPPPSAAPAAPKAIAPIRFSPPPPASSSAPPSTPASAPEVKAPLPLEPSPPSPSTKKEISPNGTGGPAAERVPASSGSPVPTPLPSPLAPSEPTRIPFKITPPSNDLRKESKFPAPRTDPTTLEFSSSGPRISLPLRNILRNLAPFQLAGSIDAVPETTRIEIPFSILQPQLSLGRVALSPAQFQAALPEEHRALFQADPAGTPVALALQDVLQNLPDESLQLRGDQEEPELGEAFETPFSQKASEDAARMKVSGGPVSKTAATTEAAPKVAVPATPTPPPPAPASAAPPAKETPAEVAKKSTLKPAQLTPKPVSAAKTATAPIAKPSAEGPKAGAPQRRTALQNALDTDEALDAKTVAGHLSRLPGVRACAIVFSDGLSLAGNIPEEYEADALCAMAPSILQRIGEQMDGAKFGTLSCLTLYCAKTPVSLFAHGNICLAAIHAEGEITPEVRARLGRATQELARMYTQPNA